MILMHFKWSGFCWEKTLLLKEFVVVVNEEFIHELVWMLLNALVFENIFDLINIEYLPWCSKSWDEIGIVFKMKDVSRKMFLWGWYTFGSIA